MVLFFRKELLPYCAGLGGASRPAVGGAVNTGAGGPDEGIVAIGVGDPGTEAVTSVAGGGIMLAIWFRLCTFWHPVRLVEIMKVATMKAARPYQIGPLANVECDASHTSMISRGGCGAEATMPVIVVAGC